MSRFVFCASIIAAVLLGWYLMSLAIENQPLIEFESEVNEFAGQLNEGAIGTIDVRLSNNGPVPVLIRQISSSCGCAVVQTAEGKSFVLPHTLGAGSSLLMRVTIDTQGKQGSDSSSVHVQYEEQGQTASCSTEIRYSIVPALRNLTGGVNIVSGEPLAHAVIIGDGFPDPGIQIKAIESSSPSRVTGTADRINKTVKASIPNVGSLDMHGITARYAIGISILEKDKPFYEYLTVVPQDPELRPLVIPVHYGGKSPPHYRCYPPEIVVAENQTVTREIRIVSAVPQEGAGTLSVDAAPEFATIESINKKDCLLLKVMLELSSEVQVEDGQIRLKDESGRIVTVPIKFVSASK